jgi:undecaprenyl phosphate N,N'-diacetylbacillosamine 1-phosphate transferase
MGAGVVMTSRSFYAGAPKRLVDICASLAGLVLLAPVLIPVTAALAIANRGQPFFVQRRPGLGENDIYVLKFKTMNDARDASGELLPNHLRITPLGAFLRKTSVDELPQLWNVLRGDMSLIGPRPLLPRYIPLYNERQRRRHDVRPGITGWAQVNGRNAISWAQKFELDVWYVENVSLALDLRILWLTILKVVAREGVNAGETVTMVPFDGTN